MATFLSLTLVLAAFALQIASSQSVDESQTRKPYDVKMSEINKWNTDQWIVVGVVMCIVVVYLIVMCGACCRYIRKRRRSRLSKNTSVLTAATGGFGDR